jgi:hypothetical protein
MTLPDDFDFALKYAAHVHNSARPPTATREEFEKLVDWLRKESVERMDHARARRDGADCRTATLAELKAANKLAEKMAGRKLPAPSVESNIAYCDMQDRIAKQYETEALQLSAWADSVAGATPQEEKVK